MTYTAKELVTEAKMTLEIMELLTDTKCKKLCVDLCNIVIESLDGAEIAINGWNTRHESPAIQLIVEALSYLIENNSKIIDKANEALATYEQELSK